jgi:hypothetical protein
VRDFKAILSIFLIIATLFGCGGGGNSASSEPNTPPTAQDRSYKILSNSSIKIEFDVDDTDNDPLQIKIKSLPMHGDFNLSTLIYTPNQDFTGADSIKYSAFDGEAESQVATIQIFVTQKPTALSQSYTVMDKEPIEINLTTQGEDKNLSYIITENPIYGELNKSSEGVYVYTPWDSLFIGDKVDSFKYKIYDGDFYSDEATVTIDYTPHPDSTWIINANNSVNPYIYFHDTDPSGYSYTFENDNEIGGKVLKMVSNGIDNSVHILGYDYTDRYLWSGDSTYQNRFNISWDAKFSGDYIIYIVLSFDSNGADNNNSTIQKDLVYTPSSNGYANYTNSFMHIYLPNSNDGKWHHYERNILDDLHIFYPDAIIDYDNLRGNVNGFAVRGSGYITNIKLSP